MEYHHQQGSMDHGGDFSDYGRQQQLPPMAPRHPARPAPSVQATSGWHPGAAPGAAPSDMMGVGGPRHHMLPPNMAPMHPYSVGGGGGPTSLDQETQAQGYGEHGYHVRVPGASDGMRKPPPPHYYTTSGGGVYGTRKTGGPGAMGGAVGAGPPMGMMPSYVHHQQQSQAQQPQSQAPAPAQQQAQQQQQQQAAPPSVSGVGAPRSVMSPSPAPALTHKPPKGPPAQWNKETGWAREPRRTPTLGQMAAQVQAQAQATGQAEEEEGEPMQICAAGNENTGRWTRAEHERFLNALKRYGKEWKRVAAAVRTRTVVQTRTHAQKYFQKLQKQLATGVGLAKALEMTMEDDSDADSDGDGSGGRQRGGGGGSRRKVTGGARGGGGGSGPRRMATAPSPPPAERMSDNEMGDEEEEDEDAMDDHAAESIQIMALEPQQRNISPALLSSTLRRIQPSLSIDIPDEGRGVSPLLAGGNRPQPSPAACGKRKATELEVAQALAGAAHQDMGGEDMLKNLRATDAEGEAAALRARLHNHHIQQQQSSTQQLHIPLSSQQPLTITNPDELEPVPGPQTVPLTPWDTEVKKLTAVYFPNNGAPEQPVGPSALEVEVLSLVRSGDLHALRKLLSRHREERLRMSGGVGKGELDLHSGDSSGQTALMVAAGLDPSVVPEKWAVELCSTLLEFASDPIITAVDNLCCTALHWAARRGNAEVVRLLVSRKASVNAQNQDGDTPLHWASRAGRTAVIKTLIEACATTHTRNRKSQSVLDVAGAGFDPDKGVLRSEEERRARDRLRDEVRRTIFELEPRLRTVIAYHPECLDHQPASRGSELESPDRVEAVMSGLQHQSDSDASPPFPSYMVEVTSGFDRATVEAVSKVHSADYVQFLDLLSREVAAKGGQPVPFKPFVPKAQITPSQPTETTQPDTTESESSLASASSSPSHFYFSGGSLNAARRSAGAVIYAVDQVVGTRKRNAFCVVRPPGHHAGVNGMKQGSAGGGLCLFNNVAIGAFHALELCERVAIIDLDAHHGDGTEDIVRTYAESNRVFLFSIHLQQQAQAQTCSPQATGLSASLVASGSGSEAGSAPSSSSSGSCNSPLVTAGTSFATQLQQNIYNVAMAPLWSKTGTSEAGGVSSSCPGGSSGGLMLQHPRGARQAPQLRGHADFRAIVTERLLPMLRSFNPNLILLSMGLNTLAKDASCCSPAGEPGLDLSVGDVAWVTRKLQEVADMCCQGRIVSVLEGGYGSRTGSDSSSPLDRSVLGAAARAHVESLVNPYRREDDDDEDELLDARFCGPHQPHHRGMAGDDVATRFKAAEAHMMMLHDRSAAITTADKNKQ